MNRSPFTCRLLVFAVLLVFLCIHDAFGQAPESTATEEEVAETVPSADDEQNALDLTVVHSTPLIINDRAPTPVHIETSSSTFDTIEEPGKAEPLINLATTASMGFASAEELTSRPYLRRGELLEVVPGMIITQHSGTGKANQYFVRGFNLDHGTDFGVFVDSMQVNNRTHGHGQGYADLNFLIPELVERLDYTKGPYFPDLGDLTSAGSARFRLYDILPESQLSVEAGQDDYFRFLALDSSKAGAGWLTTGVEYSLYDGPWVLEEDSERFNGFLKYYWESGVNRFSVTGMAYSGEWTSTDQIPRRLVNNGTIGRLGYVDPTLGGESSRYSGSFKWIHEGDKSTTEIDAYAGYYDLDLYSNFTYFLDDPVNGDQFNQVDQRVFAGFGVKDNRENTLFGHDGDFTAGFDTRHDAIGEVGLYNTASRRRIGTTRSDAVDETSLSAFADQKLVLTDWLKLSGGIRSDLFHFGVDSNLPANSGSDWAGIVSPKFGAVLGPWDETEFYFNWGGGFHSNDARGVTIATDPSTGRPATAVDPLVRQWGTEAGVRTQAIPDVTATLTVWYLESDSELLFVGDAGNTEAGPGTQRYGTEWSAYWSPEEFLHFDSELSLAQADYRNKAGGKYVENAVPATLSAGVTVGREQGPYSSLRARYFSERPLTSDKSVESRDSLVFNLRTGYRKDNWEVYVELLNLFDTDANDIEYYYESRLPGEPAGGVSDVHYHPIEPREVRTGVKLTW